MILDLIVKLMLAGFSLAFVIKVSVDYFRYKGAERKNKPNLIVNYDAEETENPYAEVEEDV